MLLYNSLSKDINDSSSVQEMGKHSKLNDTDKAKESILSIDSGCPSVESNSRSYLIQRIWSIVEKTQKYGQLQDEERLVCELQTEVTDVLNIFDKKQVIIEELQDKISRNSERNKDIEQEIKGLEEDLKNEYYKELKKQDKTLEIYRDNFLSQLKDTEEELEDSKIIIEKLKKKYVKPVKKMKD